MPRMTPTAATSSSAYNNTPESIHSHPVTAPRPSRTAGPLEPSWQGDSVPNTSATANYGTYLILPKPEGKGGGSCGGNGGHSAAADDDKTLSFPARGRPLRPRGHRLPHAWRAPPRRLTGRPILDSRFFPPTRGVGSRRKPRELCSRSPRGRLERGASAVLGLLRSRERRLPRRCRAARVRGTAARGSWGFLAVSRAWCMRRPGMSAGLAVYGLPSEEAAS